MGSIQLNNFELEALKKISEIANSASIKDVMQEIENKSDYVLSTVKLLETIDFNHFRKAINVLEKSKSFERIRFKFKEQEVRTISSLLSEMVTFSEVFQSRIADWKEWGERIERQVFEICKKYYYFISPSTPQEFRDYLLLAYRKKATKKTIEKEFFKIYKKNNWKVLDFYKKWKNNKFLEKRGLVIKDVIGYIRKSKNASPRLVLPVVISQINGILYDIALDNNISIIELRDNQKEKPKHDKKVRNEVVALLKSNSSEIQSEIAFEMIQSVLFQDVWPGKSPKRGTYNFSRHKIMHGEDTKGLTKANMIRAFLLLDFLSQFLQSRSLNSE